MEVRHLDHNEQGHDGKTQDGCRAQSTRLGAAVSANFGLESSQTIIPYLKNTQNWTLLLQKGFYRQGKRI
jgi:hypothetical protein